MSDEFKMNLPEGIEEAMSAFEDENSGVPLEERFDKLLQTMMAFSYVMTDRQRTTGLRMGDHERQWQQDTMEQIRHIESLMKIAKKYGRISSRPNEKFEPQLFAEIRKMKSSIGNIVAKVPEINESTGQPNK